ncbi:hypothetical protein F511_21780 [Dorcoceras hygrometricum]|uniref:Dystroglycan-like n=1 Tax=Dorcoceras hygrometricum TaxID=472368 RepID=A0A2Z7DCW5_9LAMI|nr:hypothetical protein F511_21780 [Dorcoceras hygrometricum]
MASSLISSSLHITFESVFDMDDAGIVQMFESFIATGLKEFLGCPAVFYEAALAEFFQNGSVRDGMVVSTIGGTTVEISKDIFTVAFELPMEGLTDLSEVPKDLVFDVRSLFSESKEQVGISCLKMEMKIEYRLLSDILAKTIYVKAASFDAVTRKRFFFMTAITFDVKVNWSRLLFDILKDMVTPGSRQEKWYAIQICVLLKNVSGLDLGDSKAFPSPRILTEKIVHRYVVINEKVGAEEVTDEPRVKKAPKTKAASKKRPADVVATKPVVKKKRTTKQRPVSSEDTLEIMAVALEVVQLQTIEPTPVEESILEEQREATSAVPIDEETTIEEKPAVEVAAESDVQEPFDESVDEQVAESIADEETIVENIVEKVDEPISLPAEADVVNKGISTADDVDVIIDQILAETAKIGKYEDDQDAVYNPSHSDVGSVHSCAPSPLEACQELLIVRATSGTGDHSPPSFDPRTSQQLNGKSTTEYVATLSTRRIGEMRVRNHRSPSHPDLNNKSKFYLNDATHGRRQQLHDLTLDNNSFQEWYRKEELLERSPTLPCTHQTMAGNDGNLLEKLPVNSTRVRRIEVDNQDNISLNMLTSLAPQNVVASTNLNDVLTNQSNHCRQQPIQITTRANSTAKLTSAIATPTHNNRKHDITMSADRYLPAVVVLRIWSTTENSTPSSVCTRKRDEIYHGLNLLVELVGTSPTTTAPDSGRRWPTGGGARWAAAMREKGGRGAASALGITDSACKNQLVMVSVQYGPFNTYIPIRSTTIGKSRVSKDPIAGHLSCRVSMTFRVVRTNQYNQDLGLIHSTNGNHLESPNEGSSIDHQVTIHLHAQNITMFPTNETWYFTSQMLVSSSGGLILILTAQSTRNEFRIHSDY